MPILKHEERIGSVFAGRYRIDSILGRGGMGVVFKGEDLQEHRSVAIKLLHYEYAERPEVVSRFIREGNMVRALKHPNIVEVFDLGQDTDGTVYLVLEFLEGRSLGDRLAELGVLGPLEAAEILLPVMNALAYAHEMGVIHRDLKPDNIFVQSVDEGKFVPKLLDFGIAKTIDAEQTALTQTGFVLGTPEYMSPEQASGDGGVGPAADIYSLGVVWYEVLSGVLPTGDLQGTAVLVAAATGRTTPLAQKAAWLPLAIVDTVDRAIQVNPMGRPDSMRDFERMMAHACGVARQSGEHRPPPGVMGRRQTRMGHLRDPAPNSMPSMLVFQNKSHGDGYELGPSSTMAMGAQTVTSGKTASHAGTAGTAGDHETASKKAGTSSPLRMVGVVGLALVVGGGAAFAWSGRHRDTPVSRQNIVAQNSDTASQHHAQSIQPVQNTTLVQAGVPPANAAAGSGPTVANSTGPTPQTAETQQNPTPNGTTGRPVGRQPTARSNAVGATASAQTTAVATGTTPAAGNGGSPQSAGSTANSNPSAHPTSATPSTTATPTTTATTTTPRQTTVPLENYE